MYHLFGGAGLYFRHVKLSDKLMMTMRMIKTTLTVKSWGLVSYVPTRVTVSRQCDFLK